MTSRNIRMRKPDWDETDYPYVVLSDAWFPAQVRGGLDEKNTFLTEKGGNQANIELHPQRGLSLRVSDDNNMAIEDTDLTQRQPKEFYATQEVVAESNSLLRQGNSRFQLQPGGHALTILTGRFGTKDLVRVTPLYKGGSPDEAPQNCNAVAADVLGTGGSMVHEVTGRARSTVKQIGGITPEEWAKLEKSEKTDQEIYDHLARRYVEHGDESVTKAKGANQYAQPRVGDAFVIVTMGYSEVVDKERGSQRVFDFKSQTYRVMNWEFHFGGVVARSGKDRITLENYARGDDRTSSPDPRWYFQMFGEKKGQSYHEFYQAKADFANPVTMVQKNPNLPENIELPPIFG